ncbi:glycosyl transferase family 41-domain-containing protein [Baffinella frigidus]|nr:glycosyl transferase family 41-domain-containing protein [Cryptophyta sp. CCMP2293]
MVGSPLWIASVLLLAVAMAQEGHQQQDRDVVALQHLTRGNDFAMSGEHRKAIVEWEQAAKHRPDSNVPWNNMANSFTALGDSTEAKRVAEEACRRGVDHLSATTTANIYRSLKLWEEAEAVLLAGIDATIRSGQSYHHPFWSLAMLYWDQGDYLGFLEYAKMGIDYKADPDCGMHGSGCQLPDFEADLATKMYRGSMELGRHAAGHRDLDVAADHFSWAQEVARGYPVLNIDEAPARWNLWCVACFRDGSEAWEGGGMGGCGDGVRKCQEEWTDTNGRWTRMMAVRSMGCDWRWRKQDEADLHRMCSSPGMGALLNHTLEFTFECDKGLVCGAGAQPPLHVWGLEMTLGDVLVMGKVQPIQLLDKIASVGPAPQWAYPAWNVRVGASFKIAYISSDLLRNHPVGNMMRAVLPLHDLSRMDVTLFVIHVHQTNAASLPENRHLLGDVKIKMLGRGPHVTQHWDETQSVEAADAVNALGICILFDLIGYTSDHRQDVLALRPAPIQVHYHGYMGTTGAPWIQYYVADRHIAPPEHAPFFSERLAMMPECFLGPSHRLTHQFWGMGDGEGGGGGGDVEGIETRREAAGVPRTGALLCFFNQHFKLDPDTFAVWTGVMRDLNSSSPTLWMLAGSPVSHRNLRREFAAAGLDPARLVFAPRVEVKEHLRRAALCDVALDTPNYNSGATAADTLFSSVPIVSLPGNKAVGRMVAAMHSALRTRELTVRTREDYAQVLRAVLMPRGGGQGKGMGGAEGGQHFGGESPPPWRMAEQLKRKLTRSILWAPLFDVAKWVADFDQLARVMWDAHVAGEPPRHLIPVRPRFS